MKPLSNTQLHLLDECTRYSISEDRNRAGRSAYYRLGGYGFTPIRYNWHTLRVLEKRGLVEYVGYWQATEEGKAFIAAERAKQEAKS